jgi:hypothetical protein
VTSNVPAIARRVHCLRPPRESWLNDLLSPLAMKYGRGVGEITAGAPNPGSFCGFVRAVRFPPSMPIPQLKASLASQLVCCRVELRPCSYRPKNKPTYCKPAAKLGRRAEHLEKDIWICWVLHGLFGMPGRLPMAFKGGTSLSKVYGAIRRFSLVLQVRVGHSSSG